MLSVTFTPADHWELMQTKSVKYLDENWASQDVELSAADLDRIRQILKENPVSGEQYSAALSHLVDRT